MPSVERPGAAVWHESEPGPWRAMNRRVSVYRRVYLAMMVLCGIPFAMGLAEAMPALTIAGLGLATALGVVAALLEQLPPKPRGADTFRLENPLDLDVCLVDLRIVSLRRPNRWDQGAAWFEDGRLLYSGLRTSFVIGGEDVLPREHWGAFEDAQGRLLLPPDALPLRAAHRSYVAFSPITRIEGGKSFEREVRFRKRLAQFRDEPPTSEGPRQLPPLAL